MYEFHPDYHDYDKAPPHVTRPENKGAAARDTYGNVVPPRSDRPGYPPTLEPGYHLLPVPPNTWGLSTEQQLMALGGKVDELIKTFNEYNGKIYGAYDAVVNSALFNDAYYGEITVEDGYIGETGAKYKAVHIPFLDRAGQPIYIELGLPHNNTTNEGLTEDCFDASQRTVADKLIPAVNAGTGFTGLALYKHAPIIGTVAPASYAEGSFGWTLGITESGFLKIYDTANTTYSDLKWDNVRNAMGVVGLLINNHVKVDSQFLAANHADTVARVGVGMNYDTKERFLVIINGDDKHGATSEMLADIFDRYRCHVAVETANSGSAFGMDKGEMLFMPATADVVLTRDGSPNAPATGAFWYITKRRHYHNEYVRDVANLMQRLGQNVWRAKLSSAAVDGIEAAVRELGEALSSETAQRKETDESLQNQITQEKTARESVDNDLYAHLHALAGDFMNDEVGGKLGAIKDALLGQIEKRISDLKKHCDNADSEIKSLIDNARTTLENYDIERVDSAIEGTKRTYRLMRKDGSDVTVPIEVYDYTALVSLLGDIPNFGELLNTFKQEFNTWKTQVDDSIRDLSAKAANLEARADATDADLASVKGSFASIQERMSALDRTVSSFQSQIVQIELTCENLKQAWAEYHTQWLQAKTEYEEWKVEVDKKLLTYATKDELKEQRLALQAAIDYSNSRIQDLVEECQTYWQKHDAFENKQTDLNKQFLHRLDEADEHRDEILTQVENLAEFNNRQAETDVKQQAAIEGLKHDVENLVDLSSDYVTNEHLNNDVLPDINSRLESLETNDTTQDNTLNQLDDRLDEYKRDLDAGNAKDAQQDEAIQRLEAADASNKEYVDNKYQEVKDYSDEKDTALRQYVDETKTDLSSQLDTVNEQQSELSDRLNELDTQLGGLSDEYVKKSGDVMTGSLQAPSFKTGTVGVLTSDAANGYMKVQTQDGGSLIPLAGGAATKDDQFITKKQLSQTEAQIRTANDAAVESVRTALRNHRESASIYYQKADANEKAIDNDVWKTAHFKAIGADVTDWNALTAPGSYYYENPPAENGPEGITGNGYLFVLNNNNYHENPLITQVVFSENKIFSRHSIVDEFWSDWQSGASDKALEHDVFKTKNFITEPNDTDWDTLTEAGCYYIDSATGNNNPNKNASLVIYVIDSGDTNYIKQLAFSSVRMYYRVNGSRGWTVWHELGAFICNNIIKANAGAIAFQDNEIDHISRVTFQVTDDWSNGEYLYGAPRSEYYSESRESHKGGTLYPNKVEFVDDSTGESYQQDRGLGAIGLYKGKMQVTKELYANTTLSGADAVEDNDFVTKQQIANQNIIRKPIVSDWVDVISEGDESSFNALAAGSISWPFTDKSIMRFSVKKIWQKIAELKPEWFEESYWWNFVQYNIGLNLTDLNTYRGTRLVQTWCDGIVPSVQLPTILLQDTSRFYGASGFWIEPSYNPDQISEEHVLHFFFLNLDGAYTPAITLTVVPTLSFRVFRV